MKIDSKYTPIRVLHILYGSGTFGGAARFAVNNLKYIDKDKVLFDFLFCNKNSLGPMENDKLLTKSKVYSLNAFETKSRFRGYVNLVKEVKAHIKRERYRVVHIDSGGQPIQLACLYACCRAGVSVRIAHSHSSGDYSNRNSLKTRLKDIIKPINRFLIRKMATDYFACSYVAGKYMFGKSGTKSKRFRIIHNAIETNKYVFDESIRRKIREENSVDSSTLVFGHVGRFDKAKNHTFLLEVFHEICKRYEDSILWIIGDGELKEIVHSAVQRSPYMGKIQLLGEKMNVNEYLQGMDALVFPSIYEGLSIVTIEAQCAGLPIFASSNISKEHNVTGNVSFYSLKDDPALWAERILEYLKCYKRHSHEQALGEAGYNIKDEAMKLQQFYLEKWLGK